MAELGQLLLGRFRSLLGGSKAPELPAIPLPEIPEHPPGLYTLDGLPILISPTQQQMQILSSDPRSVYFPYDQSTRIAKDIQAGVWTRQRIAETASNRGGRGLGDDNYMRLVVDPLMDRIAQDFGPDQPFAIRGTACSVGGDFTSQGGRIDSIATILQNGAERNADQVRTNPFVPKRPENGIRVYTKTDEWIAHHTQILRNALSSDPTKAGQIFPVMLVYDGNKIKRNDTRSMCDLPKDKLERSQVILKAYVLDYPVN